MPPPEYLKPVLTALILPPVPWLLLMLAGAGLVGRRRVLGRSLLLLGAALIWLSACQGSGRWLGRALLGAPPAISQQAIADLRAAGASAARRTTAIVVLGGGRSLLAPEYATSDLKPHSLERLRYGIFLARATGLPLAFSGGVGWAQRAAAGTSEAEIAQRVAERDFRWPLTWVEPDSRDTRENARNTLPLLRAAGVQHIVLVTHAWHMPRALRAFEQAGGAVMKITPAPIGAFGANDRAIIDWLPTTEGFEQVRLVVRETLARLVGA
jgi:uncharacterized SAM-binding protein YcdF (DUF218 family)